MYLTETEKKELKKKYSKVLLSQDLNNTNPIEQIKDKVILGYVEGETLVITGIKNLLFS